MRSWLHMAMPEKDLNIRFIKFAVITETDIFGKEQKKEEKKERIQRKADSGFSELSIGDYVVHEKHGLGIYRGIEKVEVDKVRKGLYQDRIPGWKQSVYSCNTAGCPAEIFRGRTAKPPKLNRLGGQEWKQTKSEFVVQYRISPKNWWSFMQSVRKKEGYVCGPDTVWQREFEEMFPYEETEDQLTAIEDTKKDMESTKIMDRLVCGDVDMARQRLPFVRRLKPCRRAVRSSIWYLLPFLHSRFIIPLYSE